MRLPPAEKRGRVKYMNTRTLRFVKKLTSFHTFLAREYRVAVTHWPKYLEPVLGCILGMSAFEFRFTLESNIVCINEYIHLYAVLVCSSGCMNYNNINEYECSCNIDADPTGSYRSWIYRVIIMTSSVSYKCHNASCEGIRATNAAPNVIDMEIKLVVLYCM